MQLLLQRKDILTEHPKVPGQPMHADFLEIEKKLDVLRERQQQLKWKEADSSDEQPPPEVTPQVRTIRQMNGYKANWIQSMA